MHPLFFLGAYCTERFLSSFILFVETILHNIGVAKVVERVCTFCANGACVDPTTFEDVTCLTNANHSIVVD